MKTQATEPKTSRQTDASPGPKGASADPPGYGIAFLDRPPQPAEPEAREGEPEAESAPESQEEGEYTGFRGLPFRLGGQQHHVVIKLIDGEFAVGMESDFIKIQQIKGILLGLAAKSGHELEGKATEIEDIFKPVEAAKKTFDNKEEAYRLLQEQEDSSRPAVKGKKKPSTVKIKKKPGNKKIGKPKTKKLDIKVLKLAARHAMTDAENKLTLAAKIALEKAWEDYSDFLGPTLMPVGAVFRERDFTGDTSQHTYHTGADEAHAIPIVWYKAPEDYPAVVTSDKNEHSFAGTAEASVDIGTKKLGLATANRPGNAAFKLRKVAHDGDRSGQKDFNDALNANGAGVKPRGGAVKYNALGAGGYDGDHVKDLGFNGSDAENNYWPLKAEINRRAFNGYNSGYIVNYINEKNEYKSKSIGGLVGKYFRVKSFMKSTDGNIPDETKTRYAGSNDIKP